MSALFLEKIDWARPWLTHLRAFAAPIVRASDWRAALNERAQGLRNHRGMPIHFVPQSELPPGTGYEYFISTTGNVPTRDNLHDFFNALAWLAFPNIKRRLNALQAQEIGKAADGLPGTGPSSRGKVRDAATIFDENAAILISSDEELIQMLREHRWEELFLLQRSEFGRHCEVWLFGHALLEKLVSPYKAITAHAWVALQDSAYFSMPPDEKRQAIDQLVAGRLGPDLSTSDFSPLPVLGVPGWWHEQGEEFYQDRNVFRPKRRSSGGR